MELEAQLLVGWQFLLIVLNDAGVIRRQGSLNFQVWWIREEQEGLLAWELTFDQGHCLVGWPPQVSFSFSELFLSVLG